MTNIQIFKTDRPCFFVRQEIKFARVRSEFAGKRKERVLAKAKLSKSLAADNINAVTSPKAAKPAP